MTDTASILTDEEREAMTAYNDNMICFPLLFRHKDFLTVHNVPVQNIDKEIDSILEQLFLFESVMDRIQDRRRRVILRCRYALGMKIANIAFLMNISNLSVIKESRIDLEDV